MKVVLDTNVFVSALIVKVGKPAQILRLIGTYELLTTEEILAELKRVLGYNRIRKRYRISDSDSTAYIQRLREVSTILQLKTKVETIRVDPDDNKFLALAKEAEVDYIVSGDPHLKDLSEFEGIPILAPAQFLELLEDK